MARQVTMSEDRSFIFDGGRTGALLLHGLGGTLVEMRFVALALARAGMTVLCPQLAAHTGSLDELQESRWQDWYASAEAALDQLRRRCDTVIVAGLSMGAVLALMLAAERKKMSTARHSMRPRSRSMDGVCRGTRGCLSWYSRSRWPRGSTLPSARPMA